MRLRLGLVDGATGQLVKRVVVVQRDPVTKQLYYTQFQQRKFLTPAQTRRCLMGKSGVAMRGVCGRRR